MVKEWLARQPRLSAPYGEDACWCNQPATCPRALSRLEQLFMFDRETPGERRDGPRLQELRYPDRAFALTIIPWTSTPPALTSERVTGLVALPGREIPRPE